MPEKKDSNPKDALGIKKVPLHAIPVRPLLEVGLAMLEGGRKYGTHNYRAVGVRMSTYYDAVMRHMMAWWEGEDNDPDSGVSHLVKAIACLFVVRDSMHMENCIDDRPIQYPGGIGMGAFNKITADLITKYPECAKPFLHHVKLMPKPEPYVPQPGDIIFVTLRKCVTALGYPQLYEAVKEYNQVGVIILKTSGGNSVLYKTKIGKTEFNIYVDEMTLLKREDN